MNHNCNSKLYAICGISLLVTLALFPTSVVANDESERYHISFVEILELAVYDLPPLCYCVNWWIRNYNDFNITVDIEQILITPNRGDTFHGLRLFIPANEDVGMSALCMYSHLLLYGNYTWVLTVRSTSGTLLDQESFTWEREFGQPHIPV